MSEERKPQAEAGEPRGEDRSRAGISRREFARRAALASAPAIVVPAIAAWSPAPPSAVSPLSQTVGAEATAVQVAAASSRQTATTSAADAQDPSLPKLSAEGQAEVDARIQSILGQYGSRLSEEQKTDIRRLCTVAQPPLDRLRAYHLENADGSALYLKPLVEREKKPASAGSSPTQSKSAAAKPAARKP
ncbi:MAG TPA: hypothetical protein VN780_04190 [Candidatus Eisenbacteria bacterium]|jgi:hypothetical protein|nr:hypothetical protein [Candidatus Eisenbacteria bacterium]